jgi:hypothetical protein
MFTTRRGSKLFLAGSLCLLSACGGSELPQTFTADTDQELEQLLPTLRPGDLITRKGNVLRIPNEGQDLYMEILYTNGHAEEIHVETKTDGKVALVHNTPSVQAMGVHALGACDEAAFSAGGNKWTKTLQWYFNASTTPTELTAQQAEDSLKAAANNITQANNDCGMVDDISATNKYMGRTTRIASGCDGTTDGFNVVGFGDLATGTLAVTCNWASGGSIVESDLRINKVDHNWTVDAASASCKNKFGLGAVMTHEFGHAFGLGHVSEDEHPTLTMSTAIGACDSSAATLGKGDILGLRSLY